MRTIENETLEKVRGRLIACLVLMHDETDAGMKEEVVQAIAEIDNVLAGIRGKMCSSEALRILARIIEKLPWMIDLIDRMK